MKLKHTLMLTALAVALNGVLVATAADQKPAKAEKAEKAQPAGKKAKRLEPAEHVKQAPAGMAQDACCRNPAMAKKPAHEHNGDKK